MNREMSAEYPTDNPQFNREAATPAEQLPEEDFDLQFVHYFPPSNGVTIQIGDTALCGVVATSTRNTLLEELEILLCPICLSLIQ